VNVRIISFEITCALGYEICNMAGPAPRIDELSSTLIHSDGKNSYNLRIIEYQNRDGVKCRKFGISEFWWCDKSNRLYPSRKHHVFLPLSVWPKLVALGDQIDQFADGFRGEGPAECLDATVELGNADQQSGSGIGRNGRAAKRVNVRADSTPIKGSNAAVNGGDDSKKQRPVADAEGHFIPSPEAIANARARQTEDDSVFTNAGSTVDDDERTVQLTI
jgi:hypothetical protein